MGNLESSPDHIEATANVQGYTFDLNTYWQEWVEAYDGAHPLADIRDFCTTPRTGALGGFGHVRRDPEFFAYLSEAESEQSDRSVATDINLPWKPREIPIA